jgi:uncharacterized protein DUF6473
VTGDGFIACIGAAQTFGRLCRAPYPRLLAKLLERDVLNLGAGGAGPALFLRSDSQSVLAKASVVVVQVMSARSQSAGDFVTDGFMSGIRTTDMKRMIAQEFFEDLLSSRPRSEVEHVVRQFRDAWAADMRRLLDSIRAPTVLFWFSQRIPDYTEQYRMPVEELFGEFPQLVNREMIERILPWADSYCECVSSRGLPRPIVDESGRPSSLVLDFHIARPAIYRLSKDSYYPSSEMHVEAAEVLATVCGRFHQ